MKAYLWDYDAIDTDDVSDDNAALTAVIDKYSSIERLPKKSCSMLNILLLIGLRWQMKMKGILSYSLISNIALQAINLGLRLHSIFRPKGA